MLPVTTASANPFKILKIVFSHLVSNFKSLLATNEPDPIFCMRQHQKSENTHRKKPTVQIAVASRRAKSDRSNRHTLARCLRAIFTMTTLQEPTQLLERTPTLALFITGAKPLFRESKLLSAQE